MYRETRPRSGRGVSFLIVACISGGVRFYVELGTGSCTSTESERVTVF